MVRDMKKYLYDYIKEIDDIIDNKKINQDIIDEHLIKIAFFQHERFIHLIVTVTYALMDLLAFLFGIVEQNILPVIIGYMMMCFLIPYIYHYFLLENGVQKMYRQYDEMIQKK